MSFEVDWNAAKVVLDFVQWMLTIAIGIYVWWSTRTRATTQALERLREDITENEKRIDRVDQRFHSMPNHSDMAAVKEEMSGLRADVREMGGTMKGLTKAVDLMTEHLMNRRQRDD